jgi:glycine dehydrogenase
MISDKTLGPYIGNDDPFIRRHIGPRPEDTGKMLKAMNLESLEDLIQKAVPASIRIQQPLKIGVPHSEYATLKEIRKIASENEVFRSFIGMGYHDCITPPVIQRNVFENPGWYTAYTPYQAEISQGRLEALLNFQTVIADLTGLPMANA